MVRFPHMVWWMPWLLFHLLYVPETMSQPRTSFNASGDTTWSGDITLMADFIIDQGHTLTIQAGSKVLLHHGVSIIAEKGGHVLVSGTASQPVNFSSLDERYLWGAILARDSSSSVTIRHAEIMQGQVQVVNHASGIIENCFLHDYTKSGVNLNEIGIIYSGKADTMTVRKCRFANNYQINFFNTPTLVEDCLFEFWFDDAVDFDDPPAQTLIRNCILRNALGPDRDGIDFGKVDYTLPGARGKVENCLIHHVSDKGVSLGEQTDSVLIRNSLIYSVSKGIAVKDNSKAYIYDNTLCKSQSGITLYEKNAGMGGGYAWTNNNISWGNDTTIHIKGNSAIEVSYSCLQNLVFPGTGNITSDPQFVDFQNNNFQLQPASPARGTGINGTDMGYAEPVGSITTFPQKIVLGDPSFVAEWHTDSIHTIYWSASPDITQVKIEFSSDGGNTWTVPADTWPAHTGQYDWTVPDVYSSSCKIRISDAANPALSSKTVGFFTISPAKGTTLPPVFSHQAGLYEQPFDLSLIAVPGATIYYTLDGSDPTDRSLVYTAPLQVEKQLIADTFPVQLITAGIAPQEPISFIRDNPFGIWPSWNKPIGNTLRGTVIKARAYVPGTGLSHITTNSYFVSEDIFNRYGDCPVISLTTNKDNLFDYHKGIYITGVNFTPPPDDPNFFQYGNYMQRGRSWERPAFFEFFESGGTRVIAHDIGIRVRGEWVRYLPQKSLTLYSRTEYDSINNKFEHPVFPGNTKQGSGEPLNEYKRLILRNNYYCDRLTDEWAHLLFRRSNMKIQDARFTIVFINGEYWGVNNLRENIDEWTIQHTYNVRREIVDILEDKFGWVSQAAGSVAAWYDYFTLREFIKNEDLTIPEKYNHVTGKIDIDNFCDNWISQIYSGNFYTNHNLIYWRVDTVQTNPHAPYGLDSKWRWLLNDLDAAMGNGYGYTVNTIDTVISLGDNYLLSRMLTNPQFKSLFINRFADLLNTSLKPSFVYHKLDSLMTVLRPLLPENINRWRDLPPELRLWDSVLNVRHIPFAINRSIYQQQHIKDYFNLSGITQVTLNTEDISKGIIHISTLDIKPYLDGLDTVTKPYPWTGTYFNDIPVKISAKAKPGYKFSHWKESGNTEEQLELIFTGKDTTFTAIFETDTAWHLIHYWHFNDLLSGHLDTVNADTTILGNPALYYAGSGNGYMDRTDYGEGSDLNAFLSEPAGRALRVRNPSENRELILDLPTTGYKNILFRYAVKRTPNGAEKQTIYFATDTDGISWIQMGGTTSVNETFMIKEFDFSKVEAANNNPSFKIKISFSGTNAILTEGNIRFDNISLDGDIYTPTFIDTTVYEAFKVYPNPTDGIIKVRFHRTMPQVTLEVINSLGSVAQTLNPGNAVAGQEYQLDLSTLGKGVYYIRLKTNNNTFTQKVVKI